MIGPELGKHGVRDGTRTLTLTGATNIAQALRQRLAQAVFRNQWQPVRVRAAIRVRRTRRQPRQDGAIRRPRHVRPCSFAHSAA